MEQQLSLLPETKIPGFEYIEDFLSMDEEAALLANIKELDWQLVKMHGVVAKRRVVHFGHNYTYEKRSIERSAPAPTFLNEMIVRAAQKMNAPASLVEEVLVSHYPPGAGIGWHRDAPMFGDTVFGISLGGVAIMKLRREVKTGFEIRKFELEPRSAYILAGAARWTWQHSIPAVKSDRYSITFRTLRKT